MKSYLELTNRYLKVQKKRSILAVIGIVLSISLVTGIGTLFISWWDSLIEDAKASNGDYHGYFESVEGSKVPRILNHIETKEYGMICEEGFAKLSPMEKLEGQPPNRYFTIEGFNDSVKKMVPLQIHEGSLPTKPDEIAIDYWALKYMPKGIKLGNTITLELGTRINEKGVQLKEPHKWSDKEVFKTQTTKQYKIVGFLKPRAVPDKFFAQAITWVDESKPKQDKNYDVLIKLDSVKNVHERIRQIGRDAGIDIKEKNKIVFNEKVLRLMGQSQNPVINSSVLSVVSIIILMVIIATIAVIYNAFNISVIERISHFGLMRCVGATPAQIRKTVIKEAMTLGIIAVPIGLALGTVAMALVFEIIKVLSPEYFVNLKLIISPYIVIGSTLLGLVTVLLSVLLPAYTASKVSPIEAVRNSRSFKKENFKKVRKSWLSLKIFGVEGWVARKNLGRNRKRFYVTVFSMVISITLFITFGSFVDFAFKSGLADKSENPNFAIKNTKNYAPVALQSEEYRDIEKIKGVKNIFKYGSMPGDVFVSPGKINQKAFDIANVKLEKNKEGRAIIPKSNIIAYGDDSLQCLKDYLDEGSIDGNAMKNGDGVIVVKSGMLYDKKEKHQVILDIASIKPGDEITIKAGPGEANKNRAPGEKTVKVLAVLKQGAVMEARNAKGGVDIITSEKLYREITGAVNYPEMVAIQLENAVDGKEVKSYLERYVDMNPEYQFMDYDQVARDYTSGWVVLSIFLYGFVAVISLIGCINIINTISTNIVLRTRELSVMRAVGMTEGSIKKLVCMESILHGIFAVIIGTAIGSGISKLIHSKLIDIREFQWGFPINQILIAAAGTILIAVIAGYIPLKRINNNVIIEGIRGEE